jgi:dolichol-phosphate mannosyltransferase
MSNALATAPVVTGAAKPATAGVELSVVVPTFNERDNVAALVERLNAALAGIRWEAIFVDDDSADGTATAVKQIAVRDCRVRCLRRVSRRGLAGACVDGMLLSAAPYIAVMDADLQHDETLLPRMLEKLRAGRADLVVGSRYLEGDRKTGLNIVRATLSRFATFLARHLGRVSLADPLSGFFMMRRDCFDPIAAKLATQGFKILLDIVITARGGLRVDELPYVFASRAHGESKLDAQIAGDFIGLLLSKATGGAVTPRFVSFALVGAVGLGVHLAVLRTAMVLAGMQFGTAQITATVVAMTGNFLLNNELTYRDKHLTGLAMLRGLLGFYGVSTFGAVANVSVADWLYTSEPVWWLAGAAGALMSAVWNYSMSTLFIWRVK